MLKAANALAIAAAALGGALAATSATLADDAEPVQSGKASWYGPGFHGKLTANGERFNTNDLTAAHKTPSVRHRGAGHQRAHGKISGGAHQ